MRIAIAAALCGLLSLPACATATRGTNTAWQVNTIPSGASVQTTNGHYCSATPCAIKMPRRSDFTATISLAGYEDATVAVTNQISTGGGAGMAGNVILGGVIGAGVDVASGAMLDLVPNPVTITLTPISDAIRAAATNP